MTYGICSVNLSSFVVLNSSNQDLGKNYLYNSKLIRQYDVLNDKLVQRIYCGYSIQRASA